MRSTPRKARHHCRLLLTPTHTHNKKKLKQANTINRHRVPKRKPSPAVLPASHPFSDRTRKSLAHTRAHAPIFSAYVCFPAATYVSLWQTLDAQASTSASPSRSLFRAHCPSPGHRRFPIRKSAPSTAPLRPLSSSLYAVALLSVPAPSFSLGFAALSRTH